MWPYAIPFYVVRIAEMRPVLIAVAAAITIAILIWRKPERYVLWIAAITRRGIEGVSTPEQKCIGWPEQKYISDAGKKAPELGVFRASGLGRIMRQRIRAGAA